MSDVNKRTPDEFGIYEYRRSVPRPQYPVETWLHDADLSAVEGVDPNYWKVVDDTVVEMDQSEKDAVDAALEAAREEGQTIAQMLALPPRVGRRVYCTTYKRWFYWTGNTWQCDQTIEGINNSGQTIVEGDCLVPSSMVEDGYSTTTTHGHSNIVGTTVIGAVQGGYITIAVSGVWKQSVYGSVSIGESLVSHNTNGTACGVGGPPASVSGQFATAKETKSSTPAALIKVQIGIAAHY